MLSKQFSWVSNQPKQVPDEGFNKLKNWLQKSGENPKRLGIDQAELVLSADWFDDLKNVRDANIHQGGMTIVFLEKERILFQTVKGFEKLVAIPELMYNENVVDFQLYAGMYFGYLIAFLEDFANVLEKLLPNSKYSLSLGNPRKLFGQHPPIIYSWTERLLNI